METEYNKIYFKGSRRPSPKRMMIVIPMNRYRIETNEFSYGLNFFQKTVLKFKSKPSLGAERIADLLGLNSQLITIVLNELKSKRLLNEHGALTNQGKEKLLEIDGVIVHSHKKSIGYVLQHIDEDTLYPFYLEHLTPADTLEGRYPNVITGTKGDGKDYTELPFYMNNLIKDKVNLPTPSERDILRIIQNSGKKGKESNEFEEEEQTTINLSKRLGIRILNPSPETIWVCTYIYLKPIEGENDLYNPSWTILDPFGYGDNIALKFYLNKNKNNLLLERIDNTFKNVSTSKGKKIIELQKELDRQIEEKLSNYSWEFSQLDGNLQQYIRSIEKNFILQEGSNYSDVEASDSFALTLQKVLENILKQDKEQRREHYERVYDDNGSRQRKINSLNWIWRDRLFMTETSVPNALRNASKGNLKYGGSLLSYLVSLILTYNYNNESPLFDLFKGKIDTIIEIARLRNPKSHGQTQREMEIQLLSKQQVNTYYNFIKNLINDYTKAQ